MKGDKRIHGPPIWFKFLRGLGEIHGEILLASNVVTTLEAVTKTVEEALRRYRCSWKGQFKNHKFESLELESFCLSWKGPSEVGKDQVKSERTERSRKVSSEVGKFRCSWKVLAEVGKV